MSYIVVVGGINGIGRAVVDQLKNNNKIIIIDKDYDPNIGDEIIQFKLDLSKDINIESEKELNNLFFQKKIRSFIYCAGIREICSFSKLSFEKWQEVFNVNLNSFFILIKLLSPKMLEDSAIVNISSVSGMLAEPNRVAYVTSKHALIGLTKCLAIELAHKKIRVNSVAPGVIRTPLTEEYFNDSEKIEKINKNHILNRVGTTEEIANVILFLISPKASFITGSTLYADGGWTAFKDI